MNDIFFTPEEAKRIIEIYKFFSENPDKYSYGDTSRKDFWFLLASIQDWLKTDDLSVVIEFLQGVVEGNAKEVNKATIPVNLKELVDNYKKWLSLQKEKDPALIQEVKKKAEDIASKTEEQRISSPKITKLVYQADQKKEIMQQEEKSAEIDLGKWVEQVRTEEIVAALVMGGIAQTDAKNTAPIIAQRIKDAGTKIDEAKLEKIIQDVLEKQQIAVSKEQENTVFETISGKLGVSPQSRALDSSFKVARPARPFTKPSTEVSKTDDKKIKEDYMYLLYKPQSYLQRIGGQFGFLFGGRTNNKQILEAALQRVIIENPDLYTENSLEIRLLRQGIVNLIAAQEKIDNAEFVPQNKLDEVLKKYYWSGGSTQSLKLIFQEGGVTGKKVSLEKGGESAIKNEIKGQVGSLAANAGNEASIKFKRFLTDPSLGWLRTSAAIGLGIGSISFPIPGFLRIFMGLGGLGIGAVQVGHSPKAISASFNFLNNLSMSGNNLGVPSLSSLGGNGKSGMMKWAAAMVGIVLFFIFISFNGISNSQSTFLPQAVSPINVLPDSKYISLTKTADPSNFPGEPPVQIKYTVTIGAKENNLTNIKVDEKFTSYASKGNPTIAAPTLPDMPTSLEAGKSQTIMFSVNLGKEFKDSVVTNTITVTADVVDGPIKESTTRSASVIIGNPPTFCFTFSGNWTEGDKGMIMESIGKISKSTAYASVLCSAGPIIVQRGGDKDYGGEVNGGNTITMYNRAFRNKPSLFYTFAHETGHVYGHRNGTAYVAFPVSTYGEPFLPTYTLTKTTDEDFAETIALYIVRKEVPNLSGHDIVNMETKWPKHYNFAKTNIFSDFDGF